MTAPIRQICVSSSGVGFLIEYRETRDVFRRLPGGIWGSQPVYPRGDGWVIFRTGVNDVTIWRRFVPWVGSLHPYWGET